MGDVVIMSKDADLLRRMSLEELFRRAEQFGRVMIYSSDTNRPPACYRASIVFNTIPGVNLEAKSEFSLPISDALMQAIDRAEQVAAAYGSKSR